MTWTWADAATAIVGMICVTALAIMVGALTIINRSGK